MKEYHLLFALLSLLVCDIVQARKCVCQDKKLCEPLTTPLPEKEIFAFNNNDQAPWKQFDWTRVTTICKFGQIDPEMVCYAHSKGVRVTYGGIGIDVHNTTDPSIRKAWIQKQIQFIQDNNLDGINVDLEPVVTKDQVHLRDGITSLMQEVYSAVKALNPKMQVTFDAPAYPGPPTEGIFPHYYDFKAMSKAVDFYFVMFYDMTGPNVSWANGPLNSTKWAVDLFVKEGIPVSKLVLGVPWYGWIYPCSSLQGNACHVDRKYPGTQIVYKAIVEELFPLSTAGRQFDDIAQSPFFNFKNKTSGKMQQVWYDDSESLKLRSDYAVKKDLRGVGMWTANSLDYSGSSQGKEMLSKMWNSLPKYHTSIQYEADQSGVLGKIRWIVNFIVTWFTDVKFVL